MYYLLGLIILLLLFYFYKGGNFYLISRNLVRTYKVLRSCEPPFHKNQSELLFLTAYINGVSYFEKNELMQRKLFAIARGFNDSMDEIQMLKIFSKCIITEYLMFDSKHPRNNRFLIEEVIDSYDSKIDRAIIREYEKNKKINHLSFRLSCLVATDGLAIYNRLDSEISAPIELNPKKYLDLGPDQANRKASSVLGHNADLKAGRVSSIEKPSLSSINKKHDFLIEIADDPVVFENGKRLLNDIFVISEIFDHVFKNKYLPFSSSDTKVSPGLKYLWPSECLILSFGFLVANEVISNPGFVESNTFIFLRNQVVTKVFALRKNYNVNIYGGYSSDDEIKNEILSDISSILVAVVRYEQNIQNINKYPETAFSYYVSEKIDREYFYEDLIDDLVVESCSQATAFLKTPA